MKIKVNSAAHKWGNKPYDQQIEARECIVRHLLQGEGFHNYHHTFPSVHIYYFYHFFQFKTFLILIFLKTCQKGLFCGRMGSSSIQHWNCFYRLVCTFGISL